MVRECETGLCWSIAPPAARWRWQTCLGRSDASVGYYHAGLSDEDRRLVHDRFCSGALRILAATDAFGMGIDKSDVRLVVHFDIPGSLEAYYRKSGGPGVTASLPPASCCFMNEMSPHKNISSNRRQRRPVPRLASSHCEEHCCRICWPMCRCRLVANWPFWSISVMRPNGRSAPTVCAIVASQPLQRGWPTTDDEAAGARASGSCLPGAKGRFG